MYRHRRTANPVFSVFIYRLTRDLEEKMASRNEDGRARGRRVGVDFASFPLDFELTWPLDILVSGLVT